MNPRLPVEFRDLWWAITTARYRSLRQASQVLNVRQSTLSRRLRNMEYRLGVQLFERTNGGTRPTLPGQEFIDTAQRLIDDAEAATARLKTRSRGESGRMTVGGHASLSAGNLRATIIDFRRRFPEVDTYLVDGSSDHLISDLASSAIDVAFLVEGNTRWTGKSLWVWGERVVLAILDGHALAQRDTIRWDDLCKESLLLPIRGPGPEFLKLAISKTGCSDPCRLLRHDVSLDRFLMLVSAGWGILLALEGATGVTCSGVTFREIDETEFPARLNFRACWRQENGNPSLRPFLDMLRERYPDLSGGDALG